MDKIEGGTECKYEPLEIPIKTIWKMVKSCIEAEYPKE